MQKLISTAKKSILVFLSALLMFSCPVYANAETIADNESMISPAYVTIDSNIAYISISGIKAICTANMVSKEKTLLKIKMELQKQKSTGYETVETWTTSRTDNVIYLDATRNINIFCKYRLKVTYTAGSENIVVYAYPS